MPLRFHPTSTLCALGSLILLIAVTVASPQITVVAVGQDSGDLDSFRKLYAELRERMDQDLEKAGEYLEAQIAASPDSIDLNVLRHSLASRLIEQRKYREAGAQFQKLLDFQIEHVDQRDNQVGIWMTVQSIQELAGKSGGSSRLRDGVSRGLETLLTVQAENELLLLPISQLTALQAQLLVIDDEPAAAQELIDKQLTRLDEINESQRATEQTMQAQVRMLRALTSPDRGNDPWRERCISKLDQVVLTAVERYPKSLALQTDYAGTQLLMITQWRQDDPEATKQRIEAVTDKLNRFALANRSALAILRRIEVHKERIESAKPAASLVGKPAPPWEIDAWVNEGDTTEDSLKGKVLLIDFWAMWCGPCIATFDHLRQLRTEFGDQGFEIVGVTRYYDFVWDELNSRASQSEDEVPPQEERETLERFLEHHKLSHPVIVTPEQSEMEQGYGVSGIPHVVLVDRAGIVQLVKTGAGQATADEIHAKVKELVEAK
jgi:thiol-disulfide isomerase/thioredoxin